MAVGGAGFRSRGGKGEDYRLINVSFDAAISSGCRRPVTFGRPSCLLKAKGQHWRHLVAGEQSTPSPFPIPHSPSSPETVLSKTNVYYSQLSRFKITRSSLTKLPDLVPHLWLDRGRYRLYSLTSSVPTPYWEYKWPPPD